MATSVRSIAENRCWPASVELHQVSRFGMEIIGNSAGINRVLKEIETVATTDSTVLLQGETGTGKELIARAIRNASWRRNGPFVSANCASIPAGLLESELFGHEKGAYTGAITREMGRFELANGGTFFLDEVSDIPPELQSKLLRVLQEREIERLGNPRPLRVDFRLIAATNRNLSQMVGRGEFRSDLFYRLSVFPIDLPRLRDRDDDIPDLAYHFMRKYSQALNKDIRAIRPEDMNALMRYPWPGNIRELQNTIERCVICSTSATLHPPSLPDPGDCSSTNNCTLAELERRHILRTLRETDWVIGGPDGAAVRLAVKRTTLLYKMRRLGISRPLPQGALSGH